MATYNAYSSASASANLDKTFATRSHVEKFGFVGDSFTSPTGYTNWPNPFCSYIPNCVQQDNQASGGAQASAGVAQVAALSSHCTTVFVLFGTNDAYASVSTSTYVANMLAIVTAIRARGMRPIVMAPQTSDTGAIALIMVAYYYALRVMCEQQNVQFIDSFQRLIDTDGTWKSGVAISGDPDHITAASHLQCAKDASAQYLGTSGTRWLPRNNTTSGLNPNALQLLDQGDPTGLPDGWGGFDLPGSFALADWTYPGLGKKCTSSPSHASEAVYSEFYLRMGGTTVGSRVRVSGLISFTNVVNCYCYVYARTYGGSTPDKPLITLFEATNEQYCAAEMTMPASSTGIDLYIKLAPLAAGAHSCTIAFGAFSGYVIG